MGMLGTPRRTFGNIVGHVNGVSDISKLSSWVGEQFDLQLNWDDVKRIKDWWGGKLIIKGILDADDAEIAAKSGADALIVSNHGGRQLDGAESSIAILPEVVDRVGRILRFGWMAASDRARYAKGDCIRRAGDLYRAGLFIWSGRRWRSRRDQNARNSA